MKRICFVLASLLLPSLLSAQGSQVLIPVIAKPNGIPRAGATITICNSPATGGVPCTNYASIDSDSALTQTIRQPGATLKTDGLGNCCLIGSSLTTIYAAPGNLTYTVSRTGIAVPQGPYMITVPCLVGVSCVVSTGNSTFSGSNTLTETQTATATNVLRNLKGIRFADQYSGGSVSAQINAAVSDCGSYTGNPGNSCVVAIPSTLGCGEGNQAPDNVLLWDMRNCAQSQGLRFNLSKTVTGSVRSKIFLQDNYNASTIGLSSGGNSATFYTAAYVDSPDATSGTIAAINGSMGENSLTGNFTGVLVGIEGEVGCNALGTRFTSTDCRGGTFNATQGNNQSVTNLTSLQAQRVVGSGAGTVINAVNLKIETTPTIGTSSNLALYDVGNARIDGPQQLTNGPLTIGSSFQTAVGLLLHSSNLTSASQFGMQSAPITSSAATTEGSGLVAKADTATASFTQNLNTGVHVQAPTLGAGSAINEWNGIRVEAGPSASAKFAIRTIGPEDVRFGGSLVLGNHLNQTALNDFAGTCTMSAGTTCTITLNSAYERTPGCVVTVQGKTPIAGACSVSGTRVTVTAASANSATWAAMLFGNPN